ncbi:formate dehydrogenase subunit delta [Ancylobacter crimeensis]|nr:formate dehydrogenase subunit delta [Ancylobacter crimeensis]
MRRLVYMANQIGTFFDAQRKETVVPGIAGHIEKFWDPRMRARMEDHIAKTDGQGLKPHVLEAFRTLKPVSRTAIPHAVAPAHH